MIKTSRTRKIMPTFVLTDVLGTFPRIVMYLLAFSLAIFIICFGAIVTNLLCVCNYSGRSRCLESLLDDFVYKLRKHTRTAHSDIGNWMKLCKWKMTRRKMNTSDDFTRMCYYIQCGDGDGDMSRFSVLFKRIWADVSSYEQFHEFH